MGHWQPTERTGAANAVVEAREGEDVLAILAGVERQFERLRQLQDQHAREIGSFADRRAELERCRQELNGQQRRLETRRLELEHAARTLQEQRRELDERRGAIDAAAQHLDGQRAGLEESRREWSAERERLESELQARESQLEARAHSVGDHEQRFAEVAFRLGELQAALEEAQCELDATRATADQRAAQLAAIGGELQAARARLGELESRREEAAQRAVALEAELADLRDAAESGLRRESDASARIKGLQEELQLRDEARRDLEQELEAARRQLQAAGQKLVQFSRRFSGQAVLPESAGAAGDAAPQAIAQLTRRLEESEEALRQRDEQVQELLAQVASLQSASPCNTSEHTERAAQVDQLQRQVAAERASRQRAERDFLEHRAELAAELARVRASADSRGGAGEPGGRQAVHLRRRRARLGRLRTAMRRERRRQDAVAASPAAAAEVERIRLEQRHLDEVRKLLVASEKQMVRKWARNRSVLTVFALLALLGLCAVGSWFAADGLFPPVPAATITLVPAGSVASGSPADVEWARWHTALLHDDALHAAVAKRLGERLLPHYATASDVRTLVVRELGVDAGAGVGLALTLERPSADEARTLLEVLAGTLVNESQRRTVDRGEVPALAAPGLARDGRGAIGIMPVDDQRLVTALPIFGGLCVIALTLFAIAYSQWSSARRVLDEYAELFATSAGVDPAESATLKPLVWDS